MIKLHLKSNIDLRQAETVTVVFYRDDRELLTKTGEDLDIKQSRVDLELSADDIALWEPGRYIGIDVKAAYENGDELESNYVYRSFDVTQSRTEYWANTYFGDDEPHHSDVVDTGDATLTSGSQILAPYTAYAKGNKYTGTIQTYAGQFMPVLGSIAIVTQPTQTEYEDGDDIDLTGMEVKAYYPDGSQWEGNSDYPNGIIPLSEITMEPTKAVGYQDDFWEENGVISLKVPCDIFFSGSTPSSHSGYHNKDYLGAYEITDIYGTHTVYSFYEVRGSAGDVYLTRYNGAIYGARIGGDSIIGYSSSYMDGSKVYGWGGVSVSNQKFSSSTNEDSDGYNAIKNKIPVSDTNPYNVSYSNPSKAVKKQTIAIKWNRIGDGEELETELTIDVGRGD